MCRLWRQHHLILNPHALLTSLSSLLCACLPLCVCVCVCVFVVRVRVRACVRANVCAPRPRVHPPAGCPCLLARVPCPQDLADAMSAHEISEGLELHSIKSHEWHIQGACALTGHVI